MKELIGSVAAVAVMTLTAADTVVSPDGRLAVTLDTEGEMTWRVEADGRQVLMPSKLGLAFAGNGTIKSGLFSRGRVMDKKTRSVDRTWTTKLYKKETVRDRFNEMTVDVENVRPTDGITNVYGRLTLVFRAYNEGVAFRYVVPKQPNLDGFQITRELTEWKFAGDPDVWMTRYKRHFNSNEQPFLHVKLSEADPKSEVIGMPLVVETAGRTLALTEAALANWAGFYWRRGAVTKECVTLKTELTPLPFSNASTADVAVIAETPAASPWRVVMCAKDARGLTDCNDILMNLNPPPEEGLDFSWVKPGASSWDWWVESNNSLSTELTLRLIDFAAEMGWPYHTIDGGWYGFARRPNHGPNVKIEPRPTFDLQRILAHAREKDVGVWVWLHWEALNDNGVEETFAKLEKWGVKGVKIDFHDRQDQWMVNWFEKVCRAGAKHRIMINFHGAFKPTGTNRTWPNNLTREGILGNEYNIFKSDITPTHTATLPFTRFLLGAADFTPGSFANRHLKEFVPQGSKGHRYGDETDRCPHWAEEIGTRGHALALCVAYDSPLMTLCDWPERYRGAAGVEALRALPAAWRDTAHTAGETARFDAVWRETFDGRFYFAAFTVEPRAAEVPLARLPAGTWEATVYADGPNAATDATDLAVSVKTVTASDKLTVPLAAEGGCVVILRRK